jgi:hypothetical protein
VPASDGSSARYTVATWYGPNEAREIAAQADGSPIVVLRRW